MGRITGGCACRAVRYESDADPVLMMNCHCRDCQRATGSAYAAHVVLPKPSVEIRGELRFHEVPGGSGKPVRRGFCPACGSPIAVELDRIPDVVALQAASLDDPSLHRPSLEIFTAAAQPWDHMLPGTKKVAGGIAHQARG